MALFSGARAFGQNGRRYEGRSRTRASHSKVLSTASECGSAVPFQAMLPRREVQGRKPIEDFSISSRPISTLRLSHRRAAGPRHATLNQLCRAAAPRVFIILVAHAHRNEKNGAYCPFANSSNYQVPVSTPVPSSPSDDN